MVKSVAKTSKSVIRVYDDSPEIKLLREWFPLKVNLAINQVDGLSREDLDHFLWLIRPEPKFRALAPAISRLAAIGAEMQKPGTGAPKIDWPLLLRVANEIYRLAIPFQHAIPPLFKDMGDLDGESANDLRNKNTILSANPMLFHGSQIYPLYSILSNDILLSGAISSAERQSHPYTVAMRRLAGFSIIRNQELLDITRTNQKVVDVDKSISVKITAEQQKFTDPISFQSEDVSKDRYHLYFQQIEHIFRGWSLHWDGNDAAEKLLNWAKLPYPKFKEECAQEYARLQEGLDTVNNELSENQKTLKIVCRAFSSSSRREALTHDPRLEGEGEKKRRAAEIANLGIQYRSLYRDIWFSEGDLRGNELEIIPIEDATITDEYIEQLVESGDDASEEIEDDRSDSPQLKWIAPQIGKSRLELERDSSYAQRFIAKLNQRLHWGTNVASWQEIDQFKNYLNELEGALTASKPDASERAICLSAIQVLRLMYILGVDIKTALKTQLLLRGREGWRSGDKDFEVGDESVKSNKSALAIQTLSLVKAKGLPGDKTGYIHLWRLSVPNYAWSELVNVKVDQYAPHLDAIVFQDQSGLADQLIKESPHISEVPSPLFSPGEHHEIERQCQSLLAHFNQQMDLYKAKRPLTFLKLREWSKHQMVGKKYDPKLLDILDPHTPSAFRSDSHYYTHDVYKGTKQLGSLKSYLEASVDVGDIQAASAARQSKTSIVELLSFRTQLLDRTDKKPAFRKMRSGVVGATGLIAIDKEWHPQHLIEQVQKLKQHIDIPRLANGRVQDHEKFRDAFNQLTLYCTLWFACETSQRPHHLPYIDIASVDPCLGLTRMSDKTNRAGDRLRVVWLSPLLQKQMWVYEQLRRKLLKKIVPDIAQHALYGELIWLEATTNSKKQKNNKEGATALVALPITIEKWSQDKMRGHFRNYISTSIVAQPNFHRKIIPALLKNAGVSQTDISTWHGHWQIGTAPFHQFGSHSYLEYIERIEIPLQKVIKGLGFDLVTLAMPVWPKGKT
jgi:hypothetical protein